VPVSVGEERRLGLEVAKGPPEKECIGVSASGRIGVCPLAVGVVSQVGAHRGLS
jgi:hypothetical protein